MILVSRKDTPYCKVGWIMSDVLLTIRLPEELAAKAKAANVEIESFLIDSLARKFRDDATDVIFFHSVGFNNTKSHFMSHFYLLRFKCDKA